MKQAQISKEQAQCIECGEGITNPVCPDCIKQEIISWHPELGKTLVTPTFDSGVNCMFCGRNMSICAHCYSRDVYQYLITENTVLAEEFLETFDYGLKEEFL